MPTTSFRSCPDKRLKNKKSRKAFALQDSLRKDRDSNPGNLSVQRFSRPPQSTTLPSFQYVVRSNVSFNCFAKVVILLEYTRVLCAFFLFVYSFLLRIECVGIPFLLLISLVSNALSEENSAHPIISGGIFRLIYISFQPAT